jgi:hypothetical protein
VAFYTNFVAEIWKLETYHRSYAKSLARVLRIDRFQIRFRWGRARTHPSENDIGIVIHNAF